MPGAAFCLWNDGVVRDDISPAGRIAGLVTAGCLIVAGLGFIATAWDELSCAGPDCEDWAGVAGLVSIGGLIAIGAGIRIIWTVARRPVDEEGSSLWTWGLAVVFILAALTVALLIPVATCPEGATLDPIFRVCSQDGTRTPATQWMWAKWAIALGGIVLGIAIGRLPRLIVLTALVASATWLIALGWLLQETFLRVHT